MCVGVCVSEREGDCACVRNITRNFQVDILRLAGRETEIAKRLAAILKMNDGISLASRQGDNQEAAALNGQCR